MPSHPKWPQSSRSGGNWRQDHTAKQKARALFVLREESCCPGMESRKVLQVSWTDLSIDSLPGFTRWECDTIPLECIIRITNTTNTPDPSRAGPAVLVHIPLRHASGPSHHSVQPPYQDPGLPFRLHALLSTERMHNLPPRETSPVETLQPLRRLRSNVRPPLPLGQQLRRKRQLPLLHGPTPLPRNRRDLRRLPLLVDPQPTPNHRP